MSNSILVVAIIFEVQGGIEPPYTLSVYRAITPRI